MRWWSWRVRPMKTCGIVLTTTKRGWTRTPDVVRGGHTLSWAWGIKEQCWPNKGKDSLPASPWFVLYGFTAVQSINTAVICFSNWTTFDKRFWNLRVAVWGRDVRLIGAFEKQKARLTYHYQKITGAQWQNMNMMTQQPIAGAKPILCPGVKSFFFTGQRTEARLLLCAEVVWRVNTQVKAPQIQTIWNYQNCSLEIVPEVVILNSARI
jgi:hypothetical protein